MAMATLKDYLLEMKVHWEKLGPRPPVPIAKCEYCKRDILDNEMYLRMSEIRNSEGTLIFTIKTKPDVACLTCAKSVGLEW